MAVPFIQIGQCGNQIGQAFYSQMHQEAVKASPAHQSLLQQFFTEDKAKSLLVDMEPKVVGKCLNRKGGWRYNPALKLVKEEGSGNNWANGCYQHGPSIKEDFDKIIKTLVEPQDYINMFVQLQSMAGGTGSGLGTYILTQLDKMFPKTPKIACCVMPYRSGQVILQPYNAILSLGTVYNYADGIFLIQNDAIDKICKTQLNIKGPQMEHINREIARLLTSFFFPAIPHNVNQIYSIQQNAINYGRQLCQNVFFDNRYKLANLKCAPYCQVGSQAFNYDSWQAIENQLFMRPKPFKAKLYIARGSDSTPGPPNIRTITDKHILNQYNRSGVVVQNSITCAQNIEPFVEDVCKKMSSKTQINIDGKIKEQIPYLFQYQKYGLQTQQFQQCLTTVEQVINNYKHLQ